MSDGSTRHRALGIAAGLAAMAIATHVLFSAAIGMTLEAAYRERMVDVRRWPSSLPPAGVAEMVSMYLGGRARQADATIFYGSSFAYGYPWQDTVVMSSRYAALRPDEQVLNASVIGANLALLRSGVLCGARNAGIRTRTAIVELPVINSVAALAGDAATIAKADCDLRVGQPSYTGFALRHPLGTGWAPFIWDDKAYAKGDAGIVLDKVPAGYFTTAARFRPIESAYRTEIASVIRDARLVAERVFVFPSPVFLPGAMELGEDVEAIREQLSAAVDACRTASGVVCLDPEPFYSRRDAFYNMTHLNQRGHQAMAEWLSSQIPR